MIKDLKDSVKDISDEVKKSKEEEEKPVCMSVSRTGEEISGYLLLGTDSVPFKADITAEGSLKFKKSYVSLKERYTFNGKVQYRLDSADLDIWNDRIRGRLFLYSLSQREPERPY